MTKQKNTKRALLASILSMMLCMAMLVGSTFAWFTDSVTSGKNRIVAGNLDVELYYKNAKTGDWADASKANAEKPNFFVDKNGEDILWEPGVMAVTQFKVVNKGSLALKYSLESAASGFNKLDGKDLRDVIKFAVIDGDVTISGRDDTNLSDVTYAGFESFSKPGILNPGTEDSESNAVFTVIAYWEPNAADDNLYNVKNGAKVSDYEESSDNNYLWLDIEVNLFATQTPYEEDSFDENYDANATQENEVAKFTFANASDAQAFCPDCYNARNTDEHANHTPYLNIKNGVAEIEKTGAWLSFSDLNWTENTYALEYDVDLSMLANDAFVAFNAGEQEKWTDLQIGFKRTDAGITAYNTLFTARLDATKLGTIGEKVHISYTFVPVGADLKMEMIVSDGQNTYTVERTVKNFAASTKLCWCVYTTDGDAETYAAIDNIVFR